MGTDPPVVLACFSRLCDRALRRQIGLGLAATLEPFRGLHSRRAHTRFIRQTEGRNINLLPIGYAFRPRLRSRLTLGGFTLPRKPWVFGEGDSHSLSRYSCRHSHLYAVQCSLRYTFDPHTALSYRPVPPWRVRTRSFGSALEPRSFSAQRGSTSKELPTF